jgi:hypothetical protein
MRYNVFCNTEENEPALRPSVFLEGHKKDFAGKVFPFLPGMKQTIK